MTFSLIFLSFLLFLFLIFLFVAIYSLITHKITFPFLYCLNKGEDFTIGTVKSADPLNIAFNQINHINPLQFKSNPPIHFMADPFLIKEDETFYIFYEQFLDKIFFGGAGIAVIKSKDLQNWKYLGFVLKESFHLSYPNVFKWQNNWYMIPECASSGYQKIYLSSNFPYEWKFIKNILNFPLLDPTIFIYNKVLYLLGQKIEDRSLRLYFSDSLLSSWNEHPNSPLRAGNNETRPAGKAGQIKGKLIYFVQDHSIRYGGAIIAYQIEILNEKEFVETRLKVNPILEPQGSGWAECGMHHISWVSDDENGYLCAIDGVDSGHEKKWKFDIKNLPV